MMTNGFKIVTVVFLVGLSAVHAEPKSDEFYGLHIGMTESELISELKQKGFAAPGEMPETKDKNKGSCKRDQNWDALHNGYAKIVCSNASAPTHPIDEFSAYLSDKKVVQISATFRAQKRKEAMEGILGKFGSPKKTFLFSNRDVPVESVRQTCKSVLCKTSGWVLSKSVVTVVYVGEDTSLGDAIILQMLDIAFLKKASGAIKKQRAKDAENRSEEFGF